MIGNQKVIESSLMCGGTWLTQYLGGREKKISSLRSFSATAWGQPELREMLSQKDKQKRWGWLHIGNNTTSPAERLNSHFFACKCFGSSWSLVTLKLYQRLLCKRIFTVQTMTAVLACFVWNKLKSSRKREPQGIAFIRQPVNQSGTFSSFMVDEERHSPNVDMLFG